MKKKYLLKLIEELQAKVAILETRISLLQQPATLPNIILSPVTVPAVKFPIITCQHEFPEGVWGSSVPPSCKKCGYQMPNMVTSSVSAGGTQEMAELTEHIQKNTRN